MVSPAIGAADLTVTTSVGAVLATGPHITADGLLASADKELYRAKSRGSNQVAVASNPGREPTATVVSGRGRAARTD